MAALNAYQKYREQSITTLTPGELLVLLYDEVLKNMRKARLLIGAGKLCDAHNCIIKAQNIFLYLIDSLDLKYPVSQQLLPLYDFIYRTLVKANVAKDCGALDDVLEIVSGLRDTWQEAEKINRRGGGRSA